jgi:HPt (histidine-containing phosphotransfer) domain-containing protein
MTTQNSARSELPPALQKAIEETRLRFIDTVCERLPEVEALHIEIMRNPADVEAQKKLSFIVHRLSGIAATVGYPELGSTAAEIEGILARFDQSADVKDILTGQVETLLDHMEDAIIDAS